MSKHKSKNKSCRVKIGHDITIDRSAPMWEFSEFRRQDPHKSRQKKRRVDTRFLSFTLTFRAADALNSEQQYLKRQQQMTSFFCFAKLGLNLCHFIFNLCLYFTV